MKLDSNEQRTLLLNCISSAVLSGPVCELMPKMTDIANLMNTVQAAEIEPTEESKND